MTTVKPSYVDSQSAFHQAFATDLRAVIDSLPIHSNARVLDVPCGNGFYTELLAKRTSDLVAVDSCEEHIRELKQKLPNADVRNADAYNLPEDDGSFDVLWCAESLISMEPRQAVKEFARLLSSMGLLAILEVDEYHHVMLNWPAELEAALPMAIHQASVAKYGTPLKLSPARRLRPDLRNAGFNFVRRKVLTFERQTPYDEATQKFLSGHFDYMKRFLYSYLPEQLRDEFDEQTDTANPASLFNKPDTELTVMNTVYFARKQKRLAAR